MNLIFTSPVWLIAVLTVALAAAAVEDAVRLRISNATCGIVFISALVAMALHGFSTSYWQNLVVCIAILVIGMPVFSAGWLGGGDVKLLAALGLWFDLRGAVNLMAAVFIAGGILALLFIATRRIRRAHLRSHRNDLPYGLAIVFGAVLILGMQFNERREARYPWQQGFQVQHT